MQRLIFVSRGRGGQAAVCRAAENMSSLLSVTYQLKSQFAPNVFIPPRIQTWCDSRAFLPPLICSSPQGLDKSGAIDFP